MSMQRRRIALVGLVAITMVAAFSWAFWPQPVPVDLAILARGPLAVTIEEEGETRVRDVYVVSAPITGRALRVDSDVGDSVTAGRTVVASIQETEPAFLDVRSRSQAEAQIKAAEAALALAHAEVERARAELRFAHADLRRARSLIPGETIAERTIELAELEVRTSEAQLATAEATVQVRESELDTARAALIEPAPGAALANGQPCCIDLRAPVSGRVLQVLHESEGVVQAGTPILEIGDPADLEVVVDLLSQDAVRVEDGAEVLIENWGRGQVLRGRVRRVEPYGFTKVSALGIEEQRVNVIIDFVDSDAAAQALGHGYRVNARIVVWRGEDVLKVPLSSLFRERDSWAAFVEVDGRAERRLIEIGHRNALEAEVSAGLEVDEAVVLHPSDRVAERVRIVPRAAEAVR